MRGASVSFVTSVRWATRPNRSARHESKASTRVRQQKSIVAEYDMRGRWCKCLIFLDIYMYWFLWSPWEACHDRIGVDLLLPQVDLFLVLRSSWNDLLEFLDDISLSLDNRRQAEVAHIPSCRIHICSVNVRAFGKDNIPKENDNKWMLLVRERRTHLVVQF